MTYVQRFPQVPVPEIPGKTVVLAAVVCLHIVIIGLIARELGFMPPQDSSIPTPVTLLPERARPRVEPVRPQSTEPVIERVVIDPREPELPVAEAEEPQGMPPRPMDPGVGTVPEFPASARVPPRQDPANPIGRPDYPALSVRLGESGVVQLHVCADAAGRITDAAVLSSSGFRRLDRAAVSHMTRSGTRLLPGMENGVPVPMCTEMRMRFGFEAD